MKVEKTATQPAGFAILESALRSALVIIKIGITLWGAKQGHVFDVPAF